MNSIFEDRIIDFLKTLNTEIDIVYFVDINELDLTDGSSVYDTLYQQIEDGNGFDIDIIYYATAMKYLMENDTSLKQSMEIASDMGYETANLTSEILASLLASQNAREEFAELETEITEFFEELQEEVEQEEDEDEDEDHLSSVMHGVDNNQ